MKHEHVAILIFGYDKSLLETRQWVLQTRGYRVLAASTLNEIESFPATRRVDLLLICHSVPPALCEAAIARAQSRWPGCRHLALASGQGRMPTGILGQLLHTMDGPARLISLVGSALEAPAPNTQARASSTRAPRRRILASGAPMADEDQSSTAAPLAPGLYLVATPIGNLEDITLRALRVLRSADRIACEDTRQTQKLLNHFGISTPTVSYHMHNETGRAAQLVAELAAGARIAVVSDAGTPGIADPGALLAAAAAEAGVPVIPIPGASAIITAFCASGLTGTSENAGQFHFRGFLAAKEGQRRTALEAIRDQTRELPVTQILYEAPHRVLDTLADLEAVFGPAQHIVLARELTKLHEEFLRGPLAEVRATLAARASIRGEFVLLFLPQPLASSEQPPQLTIAAEVRALMRSEGLAEMDALKRVAKARGIGKSQAYREFQRDRKS